VSAAETWEAAPGGPAFPSCLGDLDSIQDLEPVTRLYGVGRRSVLERFEHDRAVTIVGSRRASAYALRVATQLGRDLALAGFTVVSGLALGIDAAAHRGALAAGGAPVAVLANGPDVVYPPVHRELYEQVGARGALISEYPPGTQARKHQFPDRDRIMAALGKAVVIVEAALPSGSLITADAAGKLGREVGAVPGQVGARNAEGTNQLLREGAGIIRHATDVLDGMFEIDRADRTLFGAALQPHLREALATVEQGAATVDEIAAAGELDPREAAVSLAHLELLGYLEADAGGRFARTALQPPDPGVAQQAD
jgi:DNA processing protein